MYLSIVCYRHCDPEYRLFRNILSAKQYTRERFEQVVAHPEYITDETGEDDILELGYVEDDSARVIELEDGCTCAPGSDFVMVISGDCPHHGYNGHH